MTDKRYVSFDDLTACPGCDWLHYKHSLDVGMRARCMRCGDVLYTRKPYSIDRTLAASLAGIVMLALSLYLPFLTLSRGGINSSISLLDAIAALWVADMGWLGLLALGLIVLLPLARLLLLSWVLWRLRFRLGVNEFMRRALRWAERLEPWAMADIFMVGVVVSLVKISSLASLDVGPAFWSLLGLIAASTLSNIVMCQETLWQLLTTRSA